MLKTRQRERSRSRERERDKEREREMERGRDRERERDRLVLHLLGVLYVTRHTSHVTRHTSHVTRHTLQGSSGGRRRDDADAGAAAAFSQLRLQNSCC